MKKNIFISILISFSSCLIFAQEAQTGLHWKITGNGLSKPSYIYGSMHVSEKIAFHLGEEFFEAISSADQIALELNPIIFLNEIMESDIASSYIGKYNIVKEINNGFYKKSFELIIPENKDISRAIASDHYFKNWLLYRENKVRTDFEEETFLDMFIYQAGAKNNKPVVGLEDFQESARFKELASIQDIEDKEPSKWYTNLTKKKSYIDLIEEAYRTQNISMIDSLNMNISSDNYIYWMLYKRNEIMANKIDSIIQTGVSLFSGVGAAHLPGDKGIISLLEKKGYTLKPMPVTFNDKARALREEYDKKKLEPKEYFKYESDLFSIEAPVKLYETPYYLGQREFFGPELTNGAFYIIKQLSTYGLIKGLDTEKYFKKIDSLLFENIPGKIESKKVINGDFYKGFDILNKTKSGDYQRFNILITPMNIFIFKIGGKDEYVKDYGDRFFNSIVLKKPQSDWVSISNMQNDIQIDVPKYYSINFNKKVTSLYGHTEIEAFNIEDTSYYYFTRQSLYDMTFIEEDDFETYRVAEQYFKNLDFTIDSILTLREQKHPSSIAYGRTSDSSYMAIKVSLKGPYFYLMLSRTNNYQETNRFFDSFTINNFKYSFDYEEKVDSGMLFTVKSNYLLPEDITYQQNKAYYKKKNKNKTEDEDYKEKKSSSIYYSETFERMQVMTKKYHYYKNFENIDSLWNYEITNKESLYKKDCYLIEKSRLKAQENSNEVLYITFADTNSSRVLHNKYILKHGMLYQIKTVLDSSEEKSKFVNDFFTTFRPFDTIIGRSPLEDKASLFFRSIYGNDEIEKERAYKSVNYINFKLKDIDSLKMTIENYCFPPKYIETKKNLIGELLNIEGYNPIDYAINLYKKVGDTAMYQLAILNALGNIGSQQSIKAYLKLLDYDIPISGEKWRSGYIFMPFQYSLNTHKAKKEVFPDLLYYTFIEKYREKIIKTLAVQVDSNFINPNVYKKHLTQLLIEAKIVLKEQISIEQNKRSSTTRSYSYYSKNYKYKPNDLLVNYATILMPFYNKNKKVKDFINSFDRLENYNIKTIVYCKLQKQHININESKWIMLAKDPVNLAFLYEKMKKYDILKYFPNEYLVQKDIAKSILFETGFNFEKDSIEFIEKRFADDGKKSGWVYFFKTKKEGKDKWELNYIGYQPTDTSQVSLNDVVKKKNIRIDKTKDLDEIINEKIEVITLRNHPHADGSERRRYMHY